MKRQGAFQLSPIPPKALTDCMHEKQTESHKNRYLSTLFNRWDKADKARTTINGNHFTKQYNGLPTKKYLKLLQRAEAWQGISLNALLVS
jgi:hypothetical protein